MKTYRAAFALTAVVVHAACGGDVRRNSAESFDEDGGSGGTGGSNAGSAGSGVTSGQGGSGAATEKDAGLDPCAPENRPICGTMRERVVYLDSGECVLYVPHASDDPRPFDPNVLGIQVATVAGPRRLMYIDSAMECGAADTDRGLSWYFTAIPPRIVFCPGACNLIRTEASDIVELLVGCASVCPPP